MKQVPIKNRWTGSVLYTADIPDDTPSGLEMRVALEKATQAGANLVGANLVGANLVGAYLSGANLVRAYLASANLAGANLVGAYLSGAYLASANLAGAYLSGANLASANLTGANLSGADLASANLASADLEGANLVGANLASANLVGANLVGANLASAKWSYGVVISQQPIQLYGLHWSVTILDAHMQIGCELHSLAEWAEFDDARIVAMDGRDALRFWRDHKDALLSLARAEGRSFEKVEK